MRKSDERLLDQLEGIIDLHGTVGFGLVRTTTPLSDHELEAVARRAFERTDRIRFWSKFLCRASWAQTQVHLLVGRQEGDSVTKGMVGKSRYCPAKATSECHSEESQELWRASLPAM